MNTVNPWLQQPPAGTSREASPQGGAQQQRWLQDLERTWLRSWQHASPPMPGAPAEPAAVSTAQARKGDEPPQPQRMAQALPASFAASPASFHGDCRGAGDPVAQVALAQPSNIARSAPSALASEPAGTVGVHASALWQPTPISVVPPAARPQAGAPASTDSLASATFLPRPAQPPQAASLHLREPAAGSVMAALRDSHLSAAAAQLAATALARQLTQAGYAQVQVYVNGTALRRQAAEPPVHHQEKPHGH